MIAIITTAFVFFQYGMIYREAQLHLNIGTYSLHVTVHLQRVGEYEVLWDYSDGILTNIGAEYLEGKLSNSAYGNNAKFANIISLSTSSSPPSVAWTKIPSEIAINGLERVCGTYISVGIGAWTVSCQFTASTMYTDIQLTGLHWESALDSDNNLFAADTFSAVTLNPGDKLTITWTITLS